MDIQKEIEEHERVIKLFKNECLFVLKQISVVCSEALHHGNKIMLCGNGGSAADSQHIAAELVGRFHFHKERKSLPAIALTTDTSILTAVGNDYGYDDVFRRQVEGLGRKGDVLIGISTSGNSQNVIKALQEAKKMGICTVAFTGAKKSQAEGISDLTLKVPSEITVRVQECHILAGHIICSHVDEGF